MYFLLWELLNVFLNSLYIFFSNSCVSIIFYNPSPNSKYSTLSIYPTTIPSIIEVYYHFIFYDLEEESIFANTKSILFSWYSWEWLDIESFIKGIIFHAMKWFKKSFSHIRMKSDEFLNSLMDFYSVLFIHISLRVPLEWIYWLLF